MGSESLKSDAALRKWSALYRFRDLVRTLWLPLGLPIVLYNTYRAWLYHTGKSNLRNKVVLLTGASSGIGEALAHELYRQGCKLILCARREQELERVREDILRNHNIREVSPPVVLPLDLSDLHSLRRKAEEALEIYGRVDILINNGGMSYRGDVATTHMAVDIKLMVVNYLGQVALCKALLPSMLSERSGHIVVIGSVQGKIALPQRSCYAASKHALQAFCDSMRAEVADRNVSVTVINPGYVRTSLSLNAMTGDGQRYGEMDSSTASGMSPSAVAARVVRAIATGEKEVNISGPMPRLASWVRTNIPSLYFFAMQMRARKEVGEEGSGLSPAPAASLPPSSSSSAGPGGSETPASSTRANISGISKDALDALLGGKAD